MAKTSRLPVFRTGNTGNLITLRASAKLHCVRTYERLFGQIRNHFVERFFRDADPFGEDPTHLVA